MYQFSRGIYRQLATKVIADDLTVERRNQVLDACEETMRRLFTDRRYFARPTKTLFGEIRNCFPMSEQVRVYQVVDGGIKMAIHYLETTPADEVIFDAQRECRAHTRRGTQCQREPLPGRDYCPSHKHLEEAEIRENEIFAAAA